jgi:uncharacterized membrane protein
MTRALVRRIVDRLESSYWFAPLVMGLLAVLLAQVLLRIDAAIPNTRLNDSPLLYSGSAAEARAALLGLAGTILATAGVVYSLLTLPMSVAVSQFGSRLLRLFLRDRTTQLVLGMFVGTFVFCLTVALAIPHASLDPDTPQLATTAGLLLSLATFGSLIVLIHHIATSLQAPNLVASASAELQAVIRSSQSLTPTAEHGMLALTTAAEAGGDAMPAAVSHADEREATPIHADSAGYVQAIDTEKLLALAVRQDLVIRIVRKPGYFAQPGDLLALARPAERADASVAERIRDGYQLGNLRTPSQDVGYAVNQLVEVALRAMSAAINDPYTAMTCLDHLGPNLALIAERREQPTHVLDSYGRPRLLFEATDFPDLLDGAFNLLRRASRETPDVLLSMVMALNTIARKATLPDQRAALLQHVNLLDAESQASAAIAWDKERISQQCEALRALLTEQTDAAVTQSGSTLTNGDAAASWRPVV